MCSTNPSAGVLWRIQALPVDGGKARILVENASRPRYISSGRLTYWQQGTVYAAPFDVDRLEITGLPVPLVEGVAFVNRTPGYDVSSSGTLVYRAGSSGANRVVSWLDSSGKMTPILGKPDAYLSPRLSPDGKRLAFGIEKKGLWIYDFARDTRARVALDSGQLDMPVWTPDGEFLAFRSATGISVVRSDGGGKAERTQLDNGRPWTFSPDGKWLAFYQPSVGEEFHPWVVPVERTPGMLKLGQPQQLLKDEGKQFAPAISPDGRWMAYHSGETGRLEVYVVPFSPKGTGTGGKWQVSTDSGMEAIWSARGHELFFIGRMTGA